MPKVQVGPTRATASKMLDESSSYRKAVLLGCRLTGGQLNSTRQYIEGLGMESVYGNEGIKTTGGQRTLCNRVVACMREQLFSPLHGDRALGSDETSRLEGGS